MNVRRCIFVASLMTISGLSCSVRHEAAGVSSPPPVVDTLKLVFADLRDAVKAGDSQSFFNLLDSSAAGQLRRLVRRNGYSSLTSYLERQFMGWPDLDTLNFCGTRQEGEYLRLEFSGRGTYRADRKPKVKYTFLLYRLTRGGWRLVAMSNLEQERYDRFGYEVTVHETDLPPKLRFPRRF